jgi:hypothetical protein
MKSNGSALAPTGSRERAADARSALAGSQVYRPGWGGDDLFRLDDPGPPRGTQRVKEVTFQPAEWVDE